MSTESKPGKLVPIGIVLSLIGIITVVGVDGIKRILGLGDKVNQGDNLSTGENANVVIGFADGSSIQLGPNGEAVLDSDVFDLSVFGDDTDITELLQDIQAAILAGGDPSAILDAAAAGELAGSEGNTTHVQVSHDAQAPDAAVSYESQGFGGQSPDYQMPEGTEALATGAAGDQGTGGGNGNGGNDLPFLNISNISVKEPASSGEGGTGQGQGAGHGQGGGQGQGAGHGQGGGQGQGAGHGQGGGQGQGAGHGQGGGQGPGAGAQEGTTKVVEFTVTLSEAQEQDVTIHFTLNDISAERGVDYALLNTVTGEPVDAKSGVIEIPAGADSATISVVIFGDDVLEVENVPEIFTVELSNPSIELNIAESDFLGIGEIYDNEPGSVGGRTSDYQGGGIGGSDSTPGDNTATDGDDVIHGTGGDDDIDGGAGHDVIIGAGGDDRLSGSEGNDILEGKAGDDLLMGGDDNDALDGGAGDDLLIGNTGDDLLAGQVGNDQLLGGQGDDTLIGGQGADSLDGGGGADVFIYTDINEAGDTILDYKPSQGDAIDISELLDGYSETDPIENYVRFEPSTTEGSGSNEVYDLHVNPTGDVDGDFTLLATVHTSGTTDVDDLINSVVASNQVT